MDDEKENQQRLLDVLDQGVAVFDNNTKVKEMKEFFGHLDIMHLSW